LAQPLRGGLWEDGRARGTALQLKDVVSVSNVLEETFPDDPDLQKAHWDNVEAEIANLFNQPAVRAAVQDLVDLLTSRGEIDGHEAEAIIDRHLTKAPR
jgi:hypothetical protein